MHTLPACRTSALALTHASILAPQELIDQHAAIKQVMQRDPGRRQRCGTALQLPFILIQVGGGRVRLHVSLCLDVWVLTAVGSQCSSAQCSSALDWVGACDFRQYLEALCQAHLRGRPHARMVQTDTNACICFCARPASWGWGLSPVTGCVYDVRLSAVATVMVLTTICCTHAPGLCRRPSPTRPWR